MKKLIVIAAILCVLLAACNTEPVGSTSLTPSQPNQTVQVQPKACQALQGQVTQLQHMYQSALSSKRLLLLNSDGWGNTQAIDQKIHKIQDQTIQAQAKLTTCLGSSSSTGSQEHMSHASFLVPSAKPGILR